MSKVEYLRAGGAGLVKRVEGGRLSERSPECTVDRDEARSRTPRLWNHEVVAKLCPMWAMLKMAGEAQLGSPKQLISVCKD